MTVAKDAFRPSTLNILEGHESKTLDDISDLLLLVNADALRTLVTQLANGPGGGANLTWNSRNSFATGSRQAVNWAEQQFRAARATNVQQLPFNTQYCNNIVAEYRGITHPNEIVVFGAHMDSRNEGVNNTSNPAPGADDNGSGSASAINFARLIDETRIHTRFLRTLIIQTYCGEEQGLVGSGAIARDYRSRNVSVVAMYNIDMVGYRRPPPNNYTSVAFMTGSTSATLTTSCKNVARNYNTYGPSTNTYIGDTSACCSDQQSFHQQQYPAVSVFETNTSGAVYPDYHRQTDTPDKVNYDQVASFCKAIYACALQSVLTR
jgi:leucyl aminopeptidase